MSLSTIIDQYAASNPVVAAAVNSAQAESSILTGLQSGDSTDTNMLSALYSQATESETLLNSPSSAPIIKSYTPIGANIDTTA
jgi:predicted TIM-barrel enzyme